MLIYKITNLIDGKVYVGKTEKNIHERWKRHLADYKRGSTKLYNAMKKHGAENFLIECIEHLSAGNRDDLNLREVYWIAELGPEYNMTKGGDGGWIHDQTGNTWKVKDPTRMSNKKTITSKMIAARENYLIGGNNYQSKYHIHTPWGVFETWRATIQKALELKESGVEDVITGEGTIQKYCLNDIILNNEGRRTPRNWRGKSTKDLGFFVVNKNAH